MKKDLMYLMERTHPYYRKWYNLEVLGAPIWWIGTCLGMLVTGALVEWGAHLLFC